MGVAGVLAMRYNVYVITAALFASELYASLGRGGTFGEAVTPARKNLADNPLREVVFAPLPLQDWIVPVVYEATPLQLFPKAKDDGRLRINVEAGAAVTASGGFDPDLPPPPDAGFYGRDETRSSRSTARSTGIPSSSSTLMLAAARPPPPPNSPRWYSLTGGVDDPVLFTTFERYLPLPRVLDRIGQVFGAKMERAGIHWLALDDATGRQVAIQILAQARCATCGPLPLQCRNGRSGTP